MNERGFSLFLRNLHALFCTFKDLRVDTVRSSLVYASSVWRIRSLITLIFSPPLLLGS
jgi:hypothetical protein